LTEAYPDSYQDYADMDPEKFSSFIKKCQDFFSLGMFPDIEIRDGITPAELFGIVSVLEGEGREE